MKKPTLDVSKVKTLLLLHGEKMVFAVFVVLFLYFTYQGFTLEKYDRTPDDLQVEITRADNNVRTSTFDRKREGMEFVDPTTTVAQNNVQIDPAEFPLAPMNPLEFPPANKRGEPQYLPVEELQVTASFGTFQVKQVGGIPGNPNTAAGFAAKRWVCLTGLIPYQRQRLLFHEQFAKRGGGEPEWVAYRIERAEVGASQDANLQWEILSPAKAVAEQANWSGTGQELVPEEFRVPEAKSKLASMLYPLGPRAGAWTPEEVNHPKILAIIAAETPAGTTPKPAGGTAVAPAAEAGAENAEPAAGQPTAPVAPAAPVVDAFDPAAEPVTAAPAPKAKDAPVVKPVRDLRVFRYFDFDVKPGKRYVYRVTLALANPNFGKEVRDLTDPKLAVGAYRTTPPSAPSPAITVPHDASVLVAGIDPARGASEVGLRVIARQLTDQGATVLARRTARRGEEINFRAVPADEVTLVRPGGANATVDRPAEFDIRTETLVVDIREAANAAGGRDAQALMLGPDGRLVVKTQAGNAAAVANAEADMLRAVGAAPGDNLAEGDVVKTDKDKEKKEDRKRPPSTSGGGSLLEQQAAPRAAPRR